MVGGERKMRCGKGFDKVNAFNVDVVGVVGSFLGQNNKKNNEAASDGER